VFQFIVGSNNVHTSRAFLEHWTELCRSLGTPARAAAGHVPPGDDPIVFFRQLDCPTPAQQEAENAVFRQAMAQLGISPPPHDSAPISDAPSASRVPCSGFWKSPVIGWRGDVTTCTRDNVLQNRLGSIAETPFGELWWGGTARGWRRQVADGDYTGRALCQTCFIPRSLNHTGITRSEIDLWADSAEAESA